MRKGIVTLSLLCLAAFFAGAQYRTPYGALEDSDAVLDVLAEGFRAQSVEYEAPDPRKGG